MYIHFKYKNGCNPYISFNNKAFFDMICKYVLTQQHNTAFIVEEERKVKSLDHKRITWSDKKEILRDFAIEWQLSFEKFFYSYAELIEYQVFFEEYGKKYGLLREFRENGII